MAEQKVNIQTIEVYASTYSAQFLKGILKVLIDTHCKGMSKDETEAYMKSVADDMGLFKDFLIQVAKP